MNNSFVCRHLKAWILYFVAACLSSLCIGTASAQQGAMTLPRNLADLSTRADRIVQGKVVTAVVEPHPTYQHLKTLLVTLRVEDVLKGEAAKSITFRQFIWDIRDISNAAGYRPGDEVLLFLNRPTSIGLTSPVGLEQGRFRITRDRSGSLVAINGNGNSGLFGDAIKSGALNTAKLSVSSRSTVQNFRQGAVPLSALKESVRSIVQEQARTK